jgi:hypothetical protein
MSSRVTEMPRPAPGPLHGRSGGGDRSVWALAGAALATAAAWAIFSRMPAMPVRVGPIVTDTMVPLGYQLSVFPAFGAFVGTLALDVARRSERATWPTRAMLLALTGSLAAARLTGTLPLSGHALFLFGVLAYELTPPARRDAHVSLALVIPALLVVGWCKLVVWGDPLWFGVSTVLGVLIGVALARIARS